MTQLISRWGKTLDPRHVLEEYPRPSLVRDSYLNLNGEWEYAISSSEKPGAYEGTILVPFSPEAPASGVGRVLLPGQYLHYRRRFSLPTGFQKSRVLIHFGAVDQECRVWVNGKFQGEHRGGYLPFSFDITEALREGENELTLCVTDWTEKRPHARGKQKLVRKGAYASLFYTPQSGIWKTVWMESVEELFVTSVQIDPLYDESAVRILVHTSLPGQKVTMAILDQGEKKAEGEGKSGEPLTLALRDFKAWSPDSPHLYDLEIQAGRDRVRSYFGMRKVSVQRDGKGILRFFVNNKPCFFNGVLDQGYWPEGLLTAPSDQALIYDIEKLKSLGYNTIRKHVKIESERFYYHCDRLGMFVWQDMPNGGGDYDMVFVTHLPNRLSWFGRTVRDSHYGLFKRRDKKGREQYGRDLKDMIKTLSCFPSIMAWVPFNEGWGQFDAKKATALIRSWDPGRLVNEACGWFDQGGGDMYSIHNYVRKLRVNPKDRVVALTEYGGYAFQVEGHTAREKEFGYQHYRSGEELTAGYRRLWEEEILPNLERGLSSAIYTQVSDIEEEINGLMTYDREVDKMIGAEVRALNERLYRAFALLTGEEG